MKLEINSSTVKLATSLALIGCAVVLYWKLSPENDSHEENAYFYDLTEQKLFVAPRKSIPPINGLHGKAKAGVRAVVVSTSGDPSDEKHRKIGYLETYTPELKAIFEEVQRARLEGRAAEARIDRGQVPRNTLVRRLLDTEWHPLDSPEGEKIASDWNIAGPDGRMPVICSP